MRKFYRENRTSSMSGDLVSHIYRCRLGEFNPILGVAPVSLTCPILGGCSVGHRILLGGAWRNSMDLTRGAKLELAIEFLELCEFARIVSPNDCRRA